jgi:hypothetical protein
MTSAYCARKDGSAMPAVAQSMGTAGASCEGDAAAVVAVIVCVKH